MRPKIGTSVRYIGPSVGNESRKDAVYYHPGDKKSPQPTTSTLRSRVVVHETHDEKAMQMEASATLLFTISHTCVCVCVCARARECVCVCVCARVYVNVITQVI